MLLDGIDEGLTPFLMMDCCKSRKMCGVIECEKTQKNVGLFGMLFVGRVVSGCWGRRSCWKNNVEKLWGGVVDTHSDKEEKKRKWRFGREVGFIRSKSVPLTAKPL
jgi:hypothetical protein